MEYKAGDIVYKLLPNHYEVLVKVIRYSDSNMRMYYCKILKVYNSTYRSFHSGQFHSFILEGHGTIKYIEDKNMINKLLL